jgi:hypothetical protein
MRIADLLDGVSGVRMVAMCGRNRHRIATKCPEGGAKRPNEASRHAALRSSISEFFSPKYELTGAPVHEHGRLVLALWGRLAVALSDSQKALMWERTKQ